MGILCGFWCVFFVSHLILNFAWASSHLSEETCKLPTISMTCPHGRGKDMYYYNWKKKSCSTFSYKGCGGNDNRFGTKADCEAKCGIHSKKGK